VLVFTCIGLFTGTWIDKGLGLVSGGFVPTPPHDIVDYAPTVPELIISLGIFGIGFFLLTILLKIYISVREEN
jgi:molybdopterin-containing oxidoreductase family membrane subunit